MSTGGRVPFDEAYEIARVVARRLEPVTVRRKAAGSLRRRRPSVGDIEFVVEPRVERDLFGVESPAIEAIRATVRELGEWVKGGDRMMQVIDLLGRPGLKLEVYLVHPPAQWGSLLAIRTGPPELGTAVVTRMQRFGFRHVQGYAIETATREVIPTPEEKDFFALARIPCLPPQQRDLQAQELLRGRDLWRA